MGGIKFLAESVHGALQHGYMIQVFRQPRPQGFSLKKWVGQEKALASAGHVHSLNIPEKLIYMQPAGFALTEVERSNIENNNIANCMSIFSRVCDSRA